MRNRAEQTTFLESQAILCHDSLVCIAVIALLILLSSPIKGLELSGYRAFSGLLVPEYENSCLVLSPIDVRVPAWMDQKAPSADVLHDLRFSSELDAVDSIDPSVEFDPVLAGLPAAGLIASISESEWLGGNWIAGLFVTALVILLFVFAKYTISRQSALRLERLVAERTLQLQKSSDRYRSLVQNAMVGIFRVNSDGLIESANPALVKILRCESEEILLSRNLGEDIFIEPEQWDKIRNLEAEQGWITGVEVDWKRCDGERTTVRLSGRWVRSEEGDPVCELIAEDITLLIHARSAEIEAERLRGVQKLAITVAHEFNNPLSILLGTYQLYVQPNLDRFDPDTRERLERVPETVGRMRNLVTRLLRITRLRENEYVHGTSFLNLDQSADEENAAKSSDDGEDLAAETVKTYVSFP